MPRIDPLQLLNCLSVLLTPEGGILSRDEVPRLVNLMTKFSKKLVSKCVYVLILKSTGTELVDLFMAEGGWSLIQTWLQDAVQTSNWDLVREILGLLLVTPVDVERLKLNILPKLIKSLSRREDLEGVAQLSSQLVQQWLMIVKGTAGQIQQQVQAQNQIQASLPQSEPVQTPGPKIDNDVAKPIASDDATKPQHNEKAEWKEEVNNEEKTEGISTGTFYKASGKDIKLLIRKSSKDSKDGSEDVSDDSEKQEGKKDGKDKDKSKTRSSKTSSSSSSNKTKIKEKDEKKSEKDNDRDKERERDKDKKKSSHSSSSKSSSSRYKSSSSSRSKDDRDKDRHRDKGKEREKDKSKDSDRDKHRTNGALKSSSSSRSNRDRDRKDSRDKEKGKPDEKDSKEKQTEKDNNTMEKLKPPSIDKLGRIPKKTASVEDKTIDNLFDSKKKGFSVGIRKDKENEDRPKTVKVFNSKMRSTGLEEEVKPAPPRLATGSKKPTPSVQLPTIPQKRPSPPKDIREPIIPPEKKLKLDKVDLPERPGAIKLIPPKPKRIVDKKEEASSSDPTAPCRGLFFFLFANCHLNMDNDKIPWFT